MNVHSKYDLTAGRRIVTIHGHLRSGPEIGMQEGGLRPPALTRVAQALLPNATYFRTFHVTR